MGGSRITGYSPGSSVKFAVGNYQEDDQYEILPISSQLAGEQMIFDNSTQIITYFDFGNRLNSNLNTL